MKITVPSFPRSEFAKVITYKTIIKRLQNMYVDEKFIDHLIEGGNHETFQHIDPTYQEFEQAFKDLTVLRNALLKHRKKKEEVTLPVSNTTNKWLDFYFKNQKEILYRYGKIKEDQET